MHIKLGLQIYIYMNLIIFQKNDKELIYSSFEKEITQ